MRKSITCIGGLALSCAVASTVFAGAIENKTNWSAEYIRTLNRNAATDYADIAAYNPAGTVKLDEGFIINGSVQFLSKKYENIISGTTLESDEPSYIPGIFGVYNKGKWSLYGAFSNYGGGGKVDFSQGNFTTYAAQLAIIGMSGGAFVAPGPSQLSGESRYLGYTIGGAYSVNDMFSFSLGLRYIDAYREAQASATVLDAIPPVNPLPVALSFEEDGNGWGGIFGANIAPNEKINIGIRYETVTKIDLEATVKEDTLGLLPLLLGINNGQERPLDLPALLGLGVSYWITPKLRTEVNLTYYFNEDADWGGAEETVDNGYDVGIALEYIFTDNITGSIGYMHTELGVDPQYMLPENPELNANTIGAGIAYAVNEKLHTNFSIGNSFYEDDSFVTSAPLPPITVGYNKNVFFMALGLEYRFM
jgi:long-chain fatty acid transport protein